MSNVLSECVIVGKNIGSDMVMAKNRDRNYRPELHVVREIVDDVEIVYLYDLKTGWTEGMNEFGVGILNAALVVKEDENALAKVAKIGKKAMDGTQTKRALSQKNMSDVIRMLAHIETGVEGHTFVGNSKGMYSIEMTRDHTPKIKKLDTAGVNVRTNHGEDHKSAGYTTGDDLRSSQKRKNYATAGIKKAQDIRDVLRTLRSLPDNDPRMNPFRVTNNMNTTSHTLLNLTRLQFILIPVEGRCTYKGLIDTTPIDYEPKIHIEVQ